MMYLRVNVDILPSLKGREYVKIDKDCLAKFPIKRLNPNNEPYLLKINIKSGVNIDVIKYKWVDKYYGIKEDVFEISTIVY